MNTAYRVSLRRTKGFSLIDVLLALLIASMGIAGLMRYQQFLLFQFSLNAEAQSAWRLTAQLLDIYPHPLPPEFHRWTYSTEVETAMNACLVIRAKMQSPKGYRLQMSRLICQS